MALQETRAKLQSCLPTILAAILLYPTVTTAAPIDVANQSFEELACPAHPACTQGDFGAFTEGDVPQWVSVGERGSGVYNPQDLTFDPGFPSDGLQSGYANTDSSLTQDGLEEIVDGVTYTLEIDVGRRFDEPNPTCCSVLDFEVSLLAGGEAVATGDQNDIAGGIPDPGDFGTLTLSFTGDADTAGQSLGIELASFADQTNWDNVRLESGPGSGGQGGDPGPGVGGQGGNPSPGAGGQTGGGPAADDGNGCSCRANGHMESPALLAMLVLLALLRFRVRRRRQ